MRPSTSRSRLPCINPGYELRVWAHVADLDGDGLSLGSVHPGDSQTDPAYPDVNFQHRLNTSDLDDIAART